MYTSQQAARRLFEQMQQDVSLRVEDACKIAQSSQAGTKANAHYVLFYCYYYGEGGYEQNEALALSHLEEAAKLGHSQACYGFIQQFGSIRPEDSKRYLNTTLKNINDSSFNTVWHDQKSFENQLRALAIPPSYKFNLSRINLTSSHDATRLLGYNYYLSCSLNGELKKKQLIHTTLGSSNPLDLGEHDHIAQRLYQNFLEDKKGKELSNPGSAPRVGLGVIRY